MQQGQCTGGHVGWYLVVPLKPLARGKSRLTAAAGEMGRRTLALAFAQDTVVAALSCPRVTEVTVVTDDTRASRELTRLGARTVRDVPGGGLNAALTHGAATVRARIGHADVATLNADLPALRPTELSRVLNSAADFPRAFLADAEGVGTTLLTCRAGYELAPRFGIASRSRHLTSGAVELSPEDVPGARTDVDTGADLRTARTLGMGAYSTEAVARTLPAMQATSYTYDPETRSGSVLLDDGTPLSFGTAAFDAGGLRLLRAGQRVRVEIEGEGADRRITLVTLQTL